jgi:hypothetical protein
MIYNCYQPVTVGALDNTSNDKLLLRMWRVAKYLVKNLTGNRPISHHDGLMSCDDVIVYWL